MSRPLEILHMIDGRFHCGASLVTRKLVQALRAVNLEAQLICLYEGDVADAARAENLAPIILPSSGTALTRLNALKNLLQDVRDGGSNPILHSHQLRANRFASIAASRVGVPHVISVHTHKEELLRDLFPNPAKRDLMRKIHHWTLGRAAARVAVSPGILRQLLACGYSEPHSCLIRNVTTIPEPIAEAEAMRREVREELGLSPDTWLGLAAGRLVTVKQFEVLLRAVPLMTTPPLDRAVVLLAGDGDRRPALEQLASELGIAERVRFLGWRDDLQRLITAADCAISTSRSESSPVFLIEAMSMAQPVVAADAEDVVALIKDGENGLLFRVGASEELVEKMILLTQEPALRSRLGAAAREHIKEIFNNDRSISQMVDLYHAVSNVPAGVPA